MNDLLFVRHAETDLAGTFCGHRDPPVNAKGNAQIARLLESLRGQTFDAVYTSDLQRARTTAEAIADLFSIPCIARPVLREIYFGAWEGLTWQQIETQDPEYATRWLREYPSLAAPGGEEPRGFENRVHAAVDEFFRQRDHRRILVVTHAGVMRILLRSRCGLADDAAWVLTKEYCCTFPYSHVDTPIAEVQR